MSEPCIKGDKIERLEKDVININERLNRHSDKIDKISDNNLVLETILKRLEDDGQEQKEIDSAMNKTLLSVQSAMTEITFNVKEMNNKLISTDSKIESTDSKLEDTIKKINDIDNRSKFEWAGFITKTAIPFLLGGGVIYAITQLVK